MVNLQRIPHLSIISLKVLTCIQGAFGNSLRESVTQRRHRLRAEAPADLEKMCGDPAMSRLVARRVLFEDSRWCRPPDAWFGTETTVVTGENPGNVPGQRPGPHPGTTRGRTRGPPLDLTPEVAEKPPRELPLSGPKTAF